MLSSVAHRPTLAWEVAASSSERVPYGGHGQHHVQVVGTLRDVVLPDALPRVRGAVIRRLLPYLLAEQQRPSPAEEQQSRSDGISLH